MGADVLRDEGRRPEQEEDAAWPHYVATYLETL